MSFIGQDSPPETYLFFVLVCVCMCVWERDREIFDFLTSIFSDQHISEKVQVLIHKCTFPFLIFQVNQQIWTDDRTSELLHNTTALN